VRWRQGDSVELEAFSVAARLGAGCGSFSDLGAALSRLVGGVGGWVGGVRSILVGFFRL
jgi:hypothetical protein